MSSRSVAVSASGAASSETHLDRRTIGIGRITKCDNRYLRQLFMQAAGVVLLRPIGGATACTVSYMGLITTANPLSAPGQPNPSAAYLSARDAVASKAKTQFQSWPMLITATRRDGFRRVCLGFQIAIR
jgi:hypothetical protein